MSAEPEAATAALDASALRRYRPLRRLRIEGAGGGFRIVAPPSSRAVLQKRGGGALRERSPRLPHWADVWASSVGVAREILRRRVRGWSFGTVVDLGCGVGVAGIAAGLAGSRVVFADFDADACAFARHNAKECGVVDCEAVPFDWNAADAGSAAPFDHCDLVLLADVAYDFRHTAPLERLIEVVVGRGARAWIVDPFRPTAEDLLRRVHAFADVETMTISTSWEGVRHELRLVDIGPRTDRGISTS